MDWIDLANVVAGAADIVKKNLPPKRAEPIKRPQRKPEDITIDIVLPTCGGDVKYGQVLGLLMTLSSCEEVLRDSGYKYSYFIVSNGNPVTGEFRDALNRSFEYAKNTGHLGQVIESKEGLMPTGARNLGAKAGCAEYIVFMDDHVRIMDGFFSNIISTFEETGCASVRGVTLLTQADHAMSSSEGELAVWHRNLDFSHLGWGVGTPFRYGLFGPLVKLLAPDGAEKPYKIGSAWHGSFAVTRSAWEDVRGYWHGLDSAFGCEEVYLDLALGSLGYDIYLCPKVRHWHQMHSQKPYSREIGTTSINNMMCVANIIGGKIWAEVVRDNLIRSLQEYGLEVRKKEQLDALLSSALARSDEQAKWFSTKRKYSLEQLIVRFKTEGVIVLN
jgi:GT2 family glycosyltransferase